MGFVRHVWRWLQKRRFSYEPLIEVRISGSAILHNLHIFQGLNGKVAVAPVLKSNAYGHDLVEVAKIVDDESVPFLCVDSYFEALILRNEGIRSPILVLGYTATETILQSRLQDVVFGITGIEGMRELAERATQRVPIHLKFDTGMHRQGIAANDTDETYRLVRANENIAVEGVYSHIADADTRGSMHTLEQVHNWNALVSRLKSKITGVRYFHIAATSGVIFRDCDANMMRLGIGLYGVNVALQPLELRPALELTTRITSLRTLKQGESVGYNATFTAEKDMRIATLPAGYYEGVDRRLSNKGSVLVRETPCPILGRVSMNITSIDVSSVPHANVGDPVVVISSNPNDPNSVENISKACGTIPYEVLVRIPQHLRRTIV